MSNACKRIPDAPNGKPSKLFEDLMSHLHNREMAKHAWAFANSSLFKSEFSDIERDENGEPTYDVVSEILNLETLLDNSEKDMNLAMEMNLTDKWGNAEIFDNGRAALDKAKAFNDRATTKIAVVTQTEDGQYRVEVKDNTALAIAQADRNEARRKLNTGLLALLQRIGFNVDFSDDPTFDSVFNPLLAEKNAENLRTAIRVANGEQGLEDLPEETAHLILAGLKDHPLKQRIDELFTDAVVMKVLGDDYESYRQKYKKGKMPVNERLREEAEGKVFADMLKGQDSFGINEERAKITITRDEYTDEFRRVQDESNRLDEKGIEDFHSGRKELTGRQQRTLASVYGRLLTRGLRSGNAVWSSIKGKGGKTHRFAQVNPELFHDIFEVNRKYLRNGELVDLHDNYDGCKCFLTDDGLAGFAIEPDGNLVSVFSLNPRNFPNQKGVLYAIGKLAKREGATHLDAFVSDKQNLEEIYEKTLGFKTYSRDEYDMQYDHDDIAKNHGNPDIVYMGSKEYNEGKSRNPIMAARRLMTRLWDKAKSLFKKTSVEDVDNAYINARNAMQPIKDLLESGEIDTILDKESIMNHEKMYSLASKTEKLADMAQNGETLLSKQLYILQHTQSSQDTRRLKRQIELARQKLMEQKYESSIMLSLSHIGIEIRGIAQDMDDMGHLFNNTNDLNVISAESELVSRMATAVQAYTPYLQTLKTLPRLAKKGEVDLQPENAERLANIAKEYLESLNDIQDEIRKMRFSVLKQLITLYYGNMGDKPENFKETEKFKWQSVDTILSTAKEDISWWDSNLFSAGDSRNPLLNTIHHIVVSQQAKRNNRINMLCAQMQEADAMLKKAGYDNNFIYQYDEKGKPTGYYVAPVDFERFEKARAAFVESLDPEVLDFYEIQNAIEKWDNDNTEEVEVGEPIGPHGERRTERMPKKSIYENKSFQKGWSKEQISYYNSVIAMKADMDSYLPPAMRNVYLAPQVRKQLSQMFDRDGGGALKTIWEDWKKKYSVVDDNTDYNTGIPIIGIDGKPIKDGNGKKAVLCDFAGNPIKRVPIYYTHKLEDMSNLSTDGTHAMFNYISMTVNYSEMGQLANAMRLMQDHVSQDFQVVQRDAGKPIVDMFRSLGQTYQREFTKKGSESRVGKAINTFIDRTIFNETKEQMGSFSPVPESIPVIGGKAVSKDKLFNFFMKATSVSRMGINVLSGITNATQGETQMICEAAANRFFNMKDLAWAKKEYGFLLPEYMNNFNSADRHDKMYLLINQFNSGEDFFRDMTDKNFNKNPFKRVLGKGNVYFLNTMGEHYLHTSGMLMILKHEKVKRLSEPDKIVSLYDVIKPVHDDNGWHLELDSDIEFVDGNRAFLQNFGFEDKAIIEKDDRDQLFENLAVYINQVNAGMHGGYSEAEKGNINRLALGRALLQFRQWMFGMYNKLYSKQYYDASSQSVKEGGYRTLFRFITGTLYDLKNMSIKMAISNNALTVQEKQNAKVAMAQAFLFVLLSVACKLTKGLKDKDDRWIRMLAYSMKRLELETGALVPSHKFVENFFTLVQSPAAMVKTLETTASLLDINNMFDELAAGRYKGWSRGLKAAFTMTPLYNIQKVIDMKDYNYMFNIFKEK